MHRAQALQFKFFSRINLFFSSHFSSPLLTVWLYYILPMPRVLEIDLRGCTWPCAKLCHRCRRTTTTHFPNRCKTSDSFAPMVRLSIRKLKSVPIGAMSIVKQQRSITEVTISTSTDSGRVSKASGLHMPKRKKPHSTCSGQKPVGILNWGKEGHQH